MQFFFKKKCANERKAVWIGLIKFMMKVFSFDFQSLTTLKNVPSSDFGFLRHLSNIEELEIGDCSDWDNEVRTSLLV